MKIPAPVLNVLSSQAGFFARILANAIVCAIVAIVAKIGLDMSGEDVLKLTGTLATILGWILSDLVAQAQAKNVKQIQEALQPLVPAVRIDGHAGAVTVAAAQVVAADLTKAQAPTTP